MAINWARTAIQWRGEHGEQTRYMQAKDASRACKNGTGDGMQIPLAPKWSGKVALSTTAPTTTMLLVTATDVIVPTSAAWGAPYPHSRDDYYYYYFPLSACFDFLTTTSHLKSNNVCFIPLAIIVFSQSRYKGFATIVKVTPHTTETSIRAPLETRSPKRNS